MSFALTVHLSETSALVYELELGDCRWYGTVSGVHCRSNGDRSDITHCVMNSEFTGIYAVHYFCLDIDLEKLPVAKMTFRSRHSKSSKLRITISHVQVYIYVPF